MKAHAVVVINVIAVATLLLCGGAKTGPMMGDVVGVDVGMAAAVVFFVFCVKAVVF